MKRKIIAQSLLVVFLAHICWQCTDKADLSSPDQSLLNTISARLEEKNYASIKDLGNSNPHEQLGRDIEKLYHSLFDLYRYKLSGDHRFYYGNSLVPTEQKRHQEIKKMTQVALERKGIVYSETFVDQFALALRTYKFTSEDMQKYFDDAKKNELLTPLEYQILLMQCQEIALSKSDPRQQDILRTVELEVAKSNINQASKDKILMINAVARNLANDPGIALNGPFPNLFPKSQFQQTTPVVVATFFITWAVTSLIIMWTDPNCDNTCQAQMAQNAMVYGALGMLACLPSMGDACPPCNPPCFLDGDNNCIGWPCDPL
jgi:hypothetical protein